jgi:hypothetical protein
MRSVMLLSGLALAVVSTGSRVAPAQAPSTDVWIVPLVARGPALTLGTPRNVTARAGYDNQPSWATGGGAIFFTSNRDNTQTDVFRFDVASGLTVQVTNTPESEYSATAIPGADAISVVRVERDSAQRLWRFPLNGGTPSLVLADIRPVGYHAWIDARTLGLFVLGSPATLQIADASTGSARVVARSIGRGLARIPGTASVAFIEKLSASDWWVMSYEPATGTLTRIAPTLEGVEDFAWTPDGRLLMARESRVYVLNRRGRTWDVVGDLAAAGVAGITRLAVSPAGDRVALVARDRTP